MPANLALPYPEPMPPNDPRLPTETLRREAAARVLLVVADLLQEDTPHRATLVELLERLGVSAITPTPSEWGSIL